MMLSVCDTYHVVNTFHYLREGPCVCLRDSTAKIGRHVACLRVDLVHSPGRHQPSIRVRMLNMSPAALITLGIRMTRASS